MVSDRSKRRSGRGNWLTEELLRLRSLFPVTPIDRLVRLFGRSEESIRRQAQNLFAQPERSGSWAADEEEALRLAWGALDMASIVLVLARRADDVERKVHALRFVRRGTSWTSADVGMLKRLYGTRADEDLEVCLGRTHAEIRAKAEELCIAKDKGFAADRRDDRERKRMPRWTSGEVARLRELYPRNDNLYIARVLGRTVTSVANKAHQLGLRKDPAALRAMGRKNVASRYGS